MSSKEKIHRKEIFKNFIPKYEYLPPEGGWGYIITLSTSIMFIMTIVPLAAFGLIFGNFLANLGDETSGITLVNGVFNTVMSFTGLAANQLLQKMSCRKVGLIGAVIFVCGTISTIFVTNLISLVVTFGILEGLGFGLMMPAFFTLINSYFDKKKNLMMSLQQVLVVGATILWPALTKILMEEYGFRGTLTIFAALSLNCILAAITMQPVKWHMIKKKITYKNEQEIKNVNSDVFEHPRKDSVNKSDVEEALLPEGIVEAHLTRRGSYLIAKPRPSIISLGSIGISVGSNLQHMKDDATLSTWQQISKSLDLELFKDPVYVNITIGLSISLMSDLLFMSILPLLLTQFGFNAAEVTEILTIYFVCDLISRLVYSILSAVTTIWNRYIFLAGCIFNVMLRTAFVMNTSYTWVVCVIAALGFFRCFIQTPLPLVIAEAYSNRFTTAFSLFMVVCGVVSLLSGPFVGFVKSFTQSDIVVVHFLTFLYLLCSVSWLVEMLWSKLCGKKK